MLAKIHPFIFEGVMEGSVSYLRWGRNEGIDRFIIDDQRLEPALLTDRPPEWPEDVGGEALGSLWRTESGQAWARDSLTRYIERFGMNEDMVVSSRADLGQLERLAFSEGELSEGLKVAIPEMLRLSGWLAFSLRLYDLSFVFVVDESNKELMLAAERWRLARGLEMLREPSLNELVKWA